MSAQELANKYITVMEKTIAQMQRKQGDLGVSEKCVDEILGYVFDYLKDAKYFMEQRKYETALTSIAYCEGLLDALKLVDAVKFSSVN
jgi:hypothetical protein